MVTRPIAVDDAADRGAVANLELAHAGADADDDADDLVAGDHRIDAHAPIVAGHVEVANGRCRSG